MSEVRGRNHPVAASVKHLEHVHDLLLRVCVFHLARHQGEEFRKVNSPCTISVDLIDHVLKLRRRRVLAERAHYRAELLDAKNAVPGTTTATATAATAARVPHHVDLSINWRRRGCLHGNKRGQLADELKTDSQADDGSLDLLNLGSVVCAGDLVEAFLHERHSGQSMQVAARRDKRCGQGQLHDLAIRAAEGCSEHGLL
mmetsp:Transcript_92711/g.235781  ORF Transcript_92711/g.235781 Transcript_92711/m.235781 type:complete len:200 (+) Transcript_92711:785-1384(+)